MAQPVSVTGRAGLRHARLTRCLPDLWPHAQGGGRLVRNNVEREKPVERINGGVQTMTVYVFAKTVFNGQYEKQCLAPPSDMCRHLSKPD